MTCGLMQVGIYPNREIRVSLSRGPKNLRERKTKAECFRFKVVDPGGVRSRPLDILPQPSQAMLRKGRRRGPLTKEAQRKILRLAAVMRPEDKARQVFVTGTLPGSTRRSMLEFARLSGYVVKLVQTYVPRTLGVAARDLSSIYVWECQERGALHTHIVFECPDEKVANRLVVLWRWVWVKVLKAAQKKASCDLFERKYGGTWDGREEYFVTDAEIVRKSVDRYVSKYVSKGTWKHKEFFPSRWYGASSSLRERLDEFVSENSFNLPIVIRHCVDMDELKAGILRAFKRFSPKGGKDVSQWFQDWTASFFGFIPEGKSSFECIDLVLEEIGKYCVGKKREKMARNVEDICADIGDAYCRVLGKIPQWTKLQLAEDFSRAMDVEMNRETVATREGFSQFSSCLYYLCQANMTDKIADWEWPRTTYNFWKLTEDNLGSDYRRLPWLWTVRNVNGRSD